MIRLTMGGAQPVKALDRFTRVPQTGDRIMTYDGAMIAKVVVCEVVPGPGLSGVWRVELERADAW